MNEQRTFLRKIGYAVVAAALLIPLYALSQPASTESKGGLLARYRQSHGLSQANLGEIDPASETMKLATLGLSPVAITLLWDKVQYYQKVEDWTNLSATCEQIVRLEPNFAKVWEHEGWNLSHNVAVNFDDYHDRYRWIIKGVNFMKNGAAYNARNSRLPWYIGWVISWKIGRADEKAQYPKLFRADDEFHNADDPRRQPSQRDNWLVGNWWFQKAERVVDQGNPVMGNSPLIFYSNKPKCLISYAEALENENGIFGEVAKIAWETARTGWANYAAREISTLQNDTIRLADEERLNERAAKTKGELEAIVPGMREKIRDERIAKLSPRDRELVNTPREHRHVDLMAAGDSLDSKVNPNFFDVAERAPESERVRAMQLAKSITDDEATAREIELDRSQVNFVYWRDLCEMERDEDTLVARKAIYQAEEAFRLTRLEQAGKLYDEGFQAWRKALDKYPTLAQDQITVGEMNDTFEGYAKYLQQVKAPFPEDFILKDQIMLWQQANAQSAARKSIPWFKDDGSTKTPTADGATEQPATTEAKAAEAKADEPKAADATPTESKSKADDQKPADAKPTEPKTDSKPPATDNDAKPAAADVDPQPAADGAADGGAKPAVEGDAKSAPAEDAKK